MAGLGVPLTLYRAEEERGYLREQQHELERKLEAASKAEADARAEAKHAQLRFEDRDHELGERAALLRRQEAELVSKTHTVDPRLHRAAFLHGIHWEHIQLCLQTCWVKKL